MRKRIILGLSLLTLFVTVTGTAFASNTTQSASANIVPVAAGADERATVYFQASGTGFTVNGAGAGFDILSEYVSLAYGPNSVPVQTGNTPPCADDGTLGAPAEATLRMFVGGWLPVTGTDNRSLVGSQQLNTLDNINTISIRRANVLGATQLLAAGDIRPQVFQIRSCGKVINRVYS
ncbi:MAG: hypothetical protein ACRDRX_07695 [Pseudonocardiaceae bacterium]